jgi:hypothetical protein
VRCEPERVELVGLAGRKGRRGAKGLATDTHTTYINVQAIYTKIYIWYFHHRRRFFDFSKLCM